MKVAIAGGFDPFHEGHLDHLLKAASLGDSLIVMVNTDSDMVSKKGYCYQPLWFRQRVLRAVMHYHGINGNVVTIIDNDRTCCQTLEIYSPDMFVKGGDRTPDNMPQSELDTCERIGCKVVYGQGDLLNSSSSVIRS